ncbi:sugar transferase [Lutibacter flavus]|uniref:Sugar transferase involved in LPS biosynthesis (Colanic, teichoic acid) n=1 Tax=Lutibacter flavus TaxID=691689 RepID=A0A238YZR2_9FLAO|nr:sugar transferase [Lutibacter flavus]SNR76208.1 Sugar transferase involved in LPS biosynthesis (colanic, teichoic acid) [Lutibacter flavus]
MYKKIFKRAIDFLLSLLGLIFLSPLLLIITVLLAIANNGKPFFFQKRPGLNEKLFTIIKFKTMNDKTDENGQLLSDAKRLTAIGNFVRKTSLDEIPQLINVLKGDMSLIGPRPLLPQYLPLYNEFQKKRHLVRPGITGWAQINGRNTISWQQKFEYDVWYVEHLCFKLDVQIILKTIKKVVQSEGVYAKTNTMMNRFKGNN